MADLPDRGIWGPLKGCRMDQVHVVRHKVLVEGRTQRAVARELGLSRTTVGKYVGQAGPGSEGGGQASAAAGWDAVAERVGEAIASPHLPHHRTCGRHPAVHEALAHIKKGPRSQGAFDE
jgi:predicted transcriptional regulator